MILACYGFYEWELNPEREKFIESFI
jgi:hypothetical protein